MVTFSGKQVWTNLLETITLPVAANQVIALGELIEKNATGFLVKGTPISGFATKFANGVFQSFEKVDTTGLADGDVEIQVALIRSRIAIEIEAGIVIGNPVETSNNSTVKLKKAIASPAAYTRLGTLFAIDEQPEKLVSTAGDIGIIDFGMGVN